MATLYFQIGDKIRDLRRAKALSQEDLGKKVGVPTNTISRWETATYKPTPEDLEKLAKSLDVEISYFFPESEQPRLKASLQALMSATADLNERDIKELTEYARFRKARQVLNANKKSKSKPNQ